MSDGVTITLRFTVKEEEAAFFDELPALMAQTMDFKGARSVHMVRHKDNPRKAMFIDIWDREEDFDAYMAWREERGDLEMLASKMEGSIDVDVWPGSVHPRAA